MLIDDRPWRSRCVLVEQGEVGGDALYRAMALLDRFPRTVEIQETKSRQPRITCADFDDVAANMYAAIGQHAGYSRRKLLDRMIAAQAMVHRATLVTMNAEDFSGVIGLSVLAW